MLQVHKRRKIEYESSLNRLFEASNADMEVKVTFQECCEKFESLDLHWLLAPSYQLVDVAAILARHGVF